jgi:hypothetical protein
MYHVESLSKSRVSPRQPHLDSPMIVLQAIFDISKTKQIMWCKILRIARWGTIFREFCSMNVNATFALWGFAWSIWMINLLRIEVKRLIFILLKIVMTLDRFSSKISLSSGLWTLSLFLRRTLISRKWKMPKKPKSNCFSSKSGLTFTIFYPLDNRKSFTIWNLFGAIDSRFVVSFILCIWNGQERQLHQSIHIRHFFVQKVMDNKFFNQILHKIK